MKGCLCVWGWGGLGRFIFLMKALSSVEPSPFSYSCNQTYVNICILLLLKRYGSAPAPIFKKKKQSCRDRLLAFLPGSFQLGL